MEIELRMIKEACLGMGDPAAEYSPSITLIIVQKRHRSRFFPTNGENDNSGNVLPGTVVDSEICDPHYHDFYMVRSPLIIQNIYGRYNIAGHKSLLNPITPVYLIRICSYYGALLEW